MRAAFRSFAGQTKTKKSFVRIRMSIDPRSFILISRSKFFESKCNFVQVPSTIYLAPCSMNL